MAQSSWWQFWHLDSWRRWRAEQEDWRAYQADMSAVDRRIAHGEDAAALLRTQIGEIEKRLCLIDRVGPCAMPIPVAETEVGLGAVTGVSLLGLRSRWGRRAWVGADQGTVYFTDRRLVFSGRKEVEVRYESSHQLRRSRKGLLMRVSDRAKPHILAGPVEELLVTLMAARLAGQGGSPGVEERVRLVELRQALHAQEEGLEENRRARGALITPTRPFSPGWLPGAILAAGVVALTAASSGTMQPQDAIGNGPVSSVTSMGTQPSAITLPTSDAATPTSTTSVDNTSTSTDSTASSSSATSTASVAATTGPPVGAVLATGVTESVTDGDTLRVLVGGHSEPLRLIGVDAPERNECLAAEATAYLAALVESRDLYLASDMTDRDRHDRLLRYVWVDDVFVNEALVRSGLAIARRYPPDLTYAEVLEEAQAWAHQAQVGMWAPGACGPSSDAEVVITHIEYDAPGDDSQNLNGEWVTISNRGLLRVHLGGWVLKDESASHRYAFPPGFMLSAGGSVNVHTGCGQDTPYTLYWCHQGSGIWNNDGDTCFLLDPSGNIHTTLGYADG